MVRKIFHMPDKTNSILDHHQLLVKKTSKQTKNQNSINLDPLKNNVIF